MSVTNTRWRECTLVPRNSSLIPDEFNYISRITGFFSITYQRVHRASGGIAYAWKRLENHFWPMRSTEMDCAAALLTRKRILSLMKL